MVTLVKDPFVKPESGCGDGCSCNDQPATDLPKSYDGYVEPDTKVPPKANPVLAEVSVNGVAIPEAEIMAEAQQHPAKNPGEALISAAKALVIRELMLQEARALDIDPVQERHSEDRTETVEDALVRLLIEQEVQTPVTSEAERRRYYQVNSKAFHSETIYEARHILVSSKDDMQTAANMQLAKTLIEKLEGKISDFSRMAQEFSSCSSAKEGGNLGQLTRGSTVPEFEAVLEKMEPGQVWPEPVGSRFGFHIIYLVNKVPGELLPFEYVEDKIGAWLEASSWSKAASQYIGILAGKAKITGINLEGASSPLVQ